MIYEIIPLELGSIVEREIYQKGNKEIKCGVVWKLGSVATKIKPKFIKNYHPDIGICIQDIPGGRIESTYSPEKVIFFSETIDAQEEQELTEIFNGLSPKYSKYYEDVFADLGWKLLTAESFIFGELEIMEAPEDEESSLA